MSTQIRVFVVSIPLLATVAAALAAVSVGQLAPDVTIADQYNHPVRLSPSGGVPVLLIAGDRKGSDYTGNWGRGIKGAATAAGVRVIEIANLKAVPGFMHSYVKHKFLGKDSKGQPASPVVLDWEGRVASDYGFREDLTNVYLIDSDSRLRYVAAGKGTPQEIESLAQAIAKLEPSSAAASPEK